MSGGSIGYVHSDMREGHVDKFRRYAGDIIDALDRARDELGKGEMYAYRHAKMPRKLPPTDMLYTAIAAQKAKVERAAALVEAARLAVLQIDEDMVRSVDREGSGDCGLEQVVEACETAFYEMLGLPLPTFEDPPK